MKKTYILFFLVLPLLLVSGCREKPSVPVTTPEPPPLIEPEPPPASEPELTPVTETVTVGDFEIRATAAGTVCPRDALSYATYTVEILYTGTEPEVTVVYGLPFEILPDPKPLNWNVALAGEEYRTVLKPGEALTRTESYLKPEYLPRGQFTMEFTVNFSAGATKALEKYSHTFRFPLTVE